MKELTVKQIADILKTPVETAKSRIRLLGIKEAFKVGRTNVYDPNVVQQIKTPNPVGHPKKAEEHKPVKLAKGKKAKK